MNEAVWMTEWMNEWVDQLNDFYEWSNVMSDVINVTSECWIYFRRSFQLGKNVMDKWYEWLCDWGLTVWPIGIINGLNMLIVSHLF